MNGSTVVIRQRGQITIPDKIRSNMSWLQTDNVVSIRSESNEKVVIEPIGKSRPIDWKKLRAQLKRVSEYPGKRGNLSQFIAEDRENH